MGFHHHASLSIAANGFLMAQRLKAGKDAGGKKTPCNAKYLLFPKMTSLGAAQRTQRHASDSITTLRLQCVMHWPYRWQSHWGTAHISRNGKLGANLLGASCPLFECYSWITSAFFAACFLSRGGGHLGVGCWDQ
jgi:hypothetical protein